MEKLFSIDDILAFIEEEKKRNSSPAHQLSVYYEATQKALEANEKTLKLWIDYILLLEANGYTSAEIRGVYKMLKIKYWKFMGFWRAWVEYEERAEAQHEQRKARVLKIIAGVRDMLEYTSCKDKEEIVHFARWKEQVYRPHIVAMEDLFPEEAQRGEAVFLDENKAENKENHSFRSAQKSDGENDSGLAGSEWPGAAGPKRFCSAGKPPAAANAAEQMDFESTQNVLDMDIMGEDNTHTQSNGFEIDRGGRRTVEIDIDRKLRERRQESGMQGHKRIIMNGKRLKVLRTIGRGGSSKVYQVMTDKNEVLALKKIRTRSCEKDEEVFKSYKNEIEILRRMRGRREIVSLWDSYVDGGCIAILMEYGEIDLGRFLEEERRRIRGGYRSGDEMYTVWSIWDQMLRIVECIHEFRIVHRDLKPANFLFVRGRLKLIDFGISKEIKNDTTNIVREKQIGTVNYMSPEAIRDGKIKMGRSSDVWSLGCILYEMYFGESPFVRFKNLVQRMQKLLDAEYEVEYFPRREEEEYYDKIVFEIKRCLRRDPKQRSTVEELLKSDFFPRAARVVADSCGKVEFTREEMTGFVEKVMDLKHDGIRSSDGRRALVTRIVELYFGRKCHT